VDKQIRILQVRVALEKFLTADSGSFGHSEAWTEASAVGY
jgi:hypothetical protein